MFKKNIIRIYIVLVVLIVLCVGNIKYTVGLLGSLILMFTSGAKVFFLKPFIPDKLKAETESIAFIFYALFINFIAAFYINVFYDTDSLKSLSLSWLYILLALISLYIASGKYIGKDDESSEYIYDLLYF